MKHQIGFREFSLNNANQAQWVIIAIFAGINKEKGTGTFACAAGKGAIAKGAHAGNLVKAIAGCVGGGGGGRPNMAQAGGKNPSGIQDALKKAEEVLAEQIKE